MNGCESCYNWQFVLSGTYTFEGSGLTAGNYYLWCYKANNAVVSFQITVDSSGNITFNADEFPDGWLNQYGGDYYFEFSSDVNGNHIETLTINALSYNCLLLNFVCNQNVTMAEDIDTGVVLLSKLTANMNTTSDQIITLSGGTKFVITDIVITNPSVNMNGASDGEFWQSAGKTGNKIATDNGNIEELTTPDNYINASFSTAGVEIQTPLPNFIVNSPIYFSLGQAQGVDATCDIYIYGYIIQ